MRRGVGLFDLGATKGKPMMFGSELSRAVVASCALVGVFMAAYAIGASLQGSSMREAAFARTQPYTSDDDLTTGSIVFVPVLGNTCRQNTIDNRTWQVREVGTMHCTEAFAGTPNRRTVTSGPTRLDIIRESFRK
jgi:hypothetical protein